MLKVIEGGPDGLVDIPVARRELIAEDVEEGKIHLVGAVCIRGMDVGLDLGGIVKQHVEHIVTLMFIGANDPGIHGDMVGHQGVGDDPFVQPEVFGGMAGVDGMDASCQRLLKKGSPANGMKLASDLLLY